MKHRIIRTVDLLSVLLLLWMAAAAIPLHWFWFDPGQVYVSDTTPDTPPAISFTREIKRPIKMRYQVVIREMNSRRVVCDADGGPFTYSPDADLPDDLDIVWWSGGDPTCWPQVAGTYIMETCWTAPNLFFGLVPAKTTCRDSNPFSVVVGAMIN